MPPSLKAIKNSLKKKNFYEENNMSFLLVLGSFIAFVATIKNSTDTVKLYGYT